MRRIAVAMGCILLFAGALTIVVADQQRVDALNEVRSAVTQVESGLEDTRKENYRLAEQLTALRSLIAEQDAQLSDTTGFLQ